MVRISALPGATVPLAGTEEVAINQGGVSKKVAISDVRSIDITETVTTTFSMTSTTPAAVPELTTSLAPGTYLIKIWMLMQSTATGTGPGVHLNCSGGTVTACAATWYSLVTDTVATATATGVMDQASVAATFQVMNGRAQRVNNTSGGPFGGVDTANADQFAVLEGIVIVTATTSLQVMLSSETNGTGVSMRAGSTLTAQKVA